MLADRVELHVWLQWLARRAARRRPDGRAGGRDAGRASARPRRRRAPRGRRRVGAARRARARLPGRCAAGRVQPARPGLVAAAVAPGRASRRSAYAPYRDMLRTVLRHAGGLRIDHVIGLFRLWWVPRGLPATAGTYVRYDHEALVGILALEAQRAGAVVIGEDLGTVEPWVREHLRERGMLGTSILWFETGRRGDPLRARALAGGLPGDRHHPRPAADGGLPRRRARRDPRAARAAHAARSRRSARPTPSEQAAVLEHAARPGPARGDARPASRTDDWSRRCTRYLARTPGAAARGRAGRRGRRPAGAEPAGHRPGVPELAAPADRRDGRPVLLEDLRRGALLRRLVSALQG